MGRIIALVIGVILAVASFAMFVGGVALVVVHATQRDANGWYNTPTEAFSTGTYAITSRSIDLGQGSANANLVPGDFDVRLRVRSTDGSPVFVGIARADDAESYLNGVAHAEVKRVDGRGDRFRVVYRARAGGAPAVPPAERNIWVASASGPGRQTVEWAPRSGTWQVVVMRADARAGVTVDASAGAKTGLLLPIGGGLLIGGLVLAIGAVALIVFGVAGRAPYESRSGVPSTWPQHAYPVRLNARLDEPLSRWLWLVKWFLAIPHLFLLAFLWIAWWVVTVVAFFVIVCTARYPRRMFDFNVGVIRWSWRVGLYAFTLTTDRYPPFTLDPVPDYPGDFDVAYPERLSRGLVFVKSWLLAIPHLVVVAIFTGTWGSQAPSLIGVLVLVAAVVLLFTGRYPQPVFDFVLGMYRWTHRVLVYVALLRDEYPPFRIDMGGTDPAGDPHAGITPPAAADGADASEASVAP